MHINEPPNKLCRIFTTLKAKLGINFIIQHCTLQPLFCRVFSAAHYNNLHQIMNATFSYTMYTDSGALMKSLHFTYDLPILA